VSRGRLQNSALPYQTKHQLILPTCNHVTRLNVSAEHIRLKNAGSQLLIASLREQYWIPSLKIIVKSIIHQCLRSLRYKVKATEQLMGQIPSPKFNLHSHLKLLEHITQDLSSSE
jgi:hypothetical protein